VRKNDSVRAHTRFFQKCTRVVDWNSIRDTARIAQHGFPGTLYEEPIDNADDLASLGVIQRTTAIARVGAVASS